jgi:hypothetical protein
MTRHASNPRSKSEPISLARHPFAGVVRGKTVKGAAKLEQAGRQPETAEGAQALDRHR